MLNTKRQAVHKGHLGLRRQTGATLMEIMIGLGLSVIVTTSMVALMGNSLRTTTRIVEMSQLTDELRNTMSMLTRDVRRANYNPYNIYCYANADCGVGADTSVTATPDLDVVQFGGNDCLRYFLERAEPTGTPGAASGGGFRHVVAGGVGRIEMWTGNGAPGTDCSGNDWVAVTDPGFVNITAFDVDDDTGSVVGTLEAEGATLTQRTRQVIIQIEGELIRTQNETQPITRRIEDTIKVRNDFISTT
jgi:hypothetical protein